MAGVDRTIRGAGPSECAWRESPWLAELEVARFGTVVADASRIIVVSPHPDDETLGCGGLLFDAVAMGVPVMVCSVTHGERCHSTEGSPAMGAQRQRELMQAMAALGVQPSSVVSWAIADGELARQKDRLRTQLNGIVERTDLLLAPWELDGHPDHEACGEVAREVARARKLRVLRYPVWGWHWSDPTDVCNGLAAVRAFRYPLAIGTLTAKSRAIDAFQSQMTEAPGGAKPVLTDAILSRFRRGFEVYLT
ncbi:PIG-L family deacetylase [Lysobacter sp. H23M47]|uniref:PIG-L deacetylase family protein n=1 Tax=Lysobacter sp. H23M47 TaxID=2781024 RepID=UPI0018818904|nr:PIG-L family deacetylase [Lysobacter sp. H23M47]QOW24427.1 PIG-L family deacetylase [Lysobacter sp. H23M47]